MMICILLILLALFTLPAAVLAQEATPDASAPDTAQGAPDTAQGAPDATPEAVTRDELVFFRVAHLDLTGADLNLYINDAPVSMGGGDPRITPGSIYAYQPSRPGTYQIAFTAFNAGTTYIGPASLTFTSGHRYTLALIGSLTDQTLRLLFLDETQLLIDAGFDAALQSAALYVNNLAGPASVDVIDGDAVLIDDLEAAGYALSVVPASSAVREYRLRTADDETLATFPRADDPSGTFTLVALVGQWNGDPAGYGTDYGLLTPSNYIGQLVVTDGGSIPLSTPFTASFSLAASGERRRFAVTLRQQTTLTIALTAEQPSEAGARPVDPYLRIYDANQARPLAENDERPPMDPPAPTTISAAGGTLTLPAGDYFIDAASYLDLFGGTMTLTVTAEEE